MQPTIGRIVYYKLNMSDIEALEDDVIDGKLTELKEGQEVPAMIVAVVDEQHCNLRLHLDGNIMDPWVRLRCNGDEPGQWSWPPRV